MRDQDRLNLSRSDPLSCDFDGVITSSVKEPLAILVHRGPVAMDPNVRPARPICVDEAIGSVPKPARHSGPGLFADQLAHSIANRSAIAVKHIHVHPQGWPSQ